MKRTTYYTFVLFLLLCLIGTGCMNQTETESSNGDLASPPEETEEPGENEEEVPQTYHQSPMLETKDLPPVEERLPKVPKIANEMPADMVQYEIGTYGGTLRAVRTDVETDNTLFIIQNEPILNTPGLLGEEITPNVVEAYDVSDDQREFTFYMREGLKWSDGHPVTTEDVQFAVEEVLLNTEINPGGLPPWLKTAASADGTPMQFEVIDSYTFKISFDNPYGGFLMQLAVQGWRGYTDLIKPKHFLKEYHVNFTPLEELEPLIAEKGFEPGEWFNLFTSIDVLNSEAAQPKAIGFPVLSPYIQVKSGDIVEYERNPYYFKVDAAGNQLPYIDRAISTLVQDIEMVTMKIMAGEVDHSYEYVDLPKLPLMKENEEQGNYTLYMTTLHRTANDIHLNLTYDDPVWREVVRDVRFRKALNLALDKEEIAEAIFYGFANPSPIQETTYQLEEANQLLDEMGLTKGADGYRVGPDGNRFVIPFEVGSHFENIRALGELVVEQWRLLGLEVTLRQVDNTLWGTRNAANELQATIMFTPGPIQWARHEWGQNIWAPLWDRWWNTGGSEGEEPPEEVKDLYQTIFSLRELSLEEAHVRREDIKNHFKENLWYLIHTEDIAAPVAVNSNIGNFTDLGWGIAHNFGGELWFFKE